MKLRLKEKIVYGIVATLCIATISILLWEHNRDYMLSKFDEEVTVVRVPQEPTTVEGLIRRQAEEWLKTKEAYEYAQEQVTQKVIDELSKL